MNHEAAIEKHAKECLDEINRNGRFPRTTIARHMRSLLAEVAPPAPPQPAPEPTSGATEDQARCGWCNAITTECKCGEFGEAPAPTPTDVSAAAREAAEKEIQSFLCEGDHGNPEWTPTGTHVQALLSTQRATDRQRIAELQDHITSLEMELAKINPNHRALLP